MIIIRIVLAAILMPVCLSIVFTLTQVSNAKHSKKMSDDDFIVTVPRWVLPIGLVVNLMSITIMIVAIFTERPRYMALIISAIIVISPFIWIGTYLSLKTVRFSVVVKNDKITVQNIFTKPYTITINEIVLAKRKLLIGFHKKQVSEKIIVKTASGKKFTVDQIEISYERFLKKILAEVPHERLIGFDELI